jgi:hypothetical protein
MRLTVRVSTIVLSISKRFCGTARTPHPRPHSIAWNHKPGRRNSQTNRPSSELRPPLRFPSRRERSSKSKECCRRGTESRPAGYASMTSKSGVPLETILTCPPNVQTQTFFATLLPGRCVGEGYANNNVPSGTPYRNPVAAWPTARQPLPQGIARNFFDVQPTRSPRARGQTRSWELPFRRVFLHEHVQEFSDLRFFQRPAGPVTVLPDLGLVPGRARGHHVLKLPDHGHPKTSRKQGATPLGFHPLRSPPGHWQLPCTRGKPTAP